MTALYLTLLITLYAAVASSFPGLLPVFGRRAAVPVYLAAILLWATTAAVLCLPSPPMTNGWTAAALLLTGALYAAIARIFLQRMDWTPLEVAAGSLGWRALGVAMPLAQVMVLWLPTRTILGVPVPWLPAMLAPLAVLSVPLGPAVSLLAAPGVLRRGRHWLAAASVVAVLAGANLVKHPLAPPADASQPEHHTQGAPFMWRRVSRLGHAELFPSGAIVNALCVTGLALFAAGLTRRRVTGIGSDRRQGIRR
jgi:hypothetical protein